MRLPSYVKRSRHGMFYVRVVLPPPIRAKLAGRREIRRSLGTRDPRTARAWAHRLSYVVRLWVQEAHLMPAPDVDALLARLRVTRVAKYKIDIGHRIFEADPRIPGDQEAMLATIEKLGLNGPNGPAIIAAVRGSGPLSEGDVPAELACRRWSDVAEEYLTDLFQRTLNKKTQADFRGILARFQGVVGDKTIGSITVADV
jgi:hypothetical protein